MREGVRRAVLAALTFSASAALASGPVRVTGTTVTMTPPDGFTPSTAFSGFEERGSGSSITVSELPPEAHADIAAMFSSLGTARDALSPQGIAVKALASVTVEGQPAPLVVGERRAGGLVVDKYLTVLAGDTTALVTIDAVGTGAATREDAVLALESIVRTAPPTLVESIAALPFGFEAVPPFEPRRVMGGSGVVLTPFEGMDPSGERPVVVIASAMAPIDSGNLQAASERLLAGTTGFESAEAGTGEAVADGRAFAWRVEADAGERLAIHYLWPLPRDGYLRLVAMGARAELEPLRGAIGEMAASVAPAPDSVPTR